MICVALPFSCLLRLLCGIAPDLFTALAVWWCFYRMCSGCCVQPLLCHCVALPYPVCNACCVFLLLSYLQRLLCGTATVLFKALAVLLLNLMYSGCGVALPLPCLRRLCGFASILCCQKRLLCGFASILCTAVAVWHCPYPVFSVCCVVLPLTCYRRSVALDTGG